MRYADGTVALRQRVAARFRTASSAWCSAPRAPASPRCCAWPTGWRRRPAARCRSTACASSAASLARIRPRIGMIHQQFNLVLRSSVADQRAERRAAGAAAVARAAGPVSAARAAQGLRADRRGRAAGTAPARGAPASFPAASSSAWASRAPSCSTRRWCWPTSRWPASTRGQRATCWRCSAPGARARHHGAVQPAPGGPGARVRRPHRRAARGAGGVRRPAGSLRRRRARALSTAGGACAMSRSADPHARRAAPAS